MRFLLFLILCIACRAADYYVTATGNDTTGTGSAGAPYATLDKALSKATLTGGDTIHVGTGTFSADANTDFAGSVGNPIIIQGNGAAYTIITGDITLDQPYYTFRDFYHSSFRPFTLSDPADGCTLDNITFYETGTAIECGGADSLTIQNCRFSRWKSNACVNFSGDGNLMLSCTFSNSYHGADIMRCNGLINSTIRSCLFENLTMPNNAYGTATDSVLASTGSKTFNTQAGLGFNAGDYFTCYANGNDTLGMNGSVTSYNNSTGVLVFNCSSVDSGASGNTYSSWRLEWINQGNHCDIVQAFGPSVSYANVFERCRINNSPFQLGNFEQSGEVDQRDWTFRNNVFNTSRIQINVYAPGFKFYNNTVYNASGTTGFRGATAPKGDGNPLLVYNNIFCRVGQGNESAGPYSGATANYNLITDYDDTAKTGFSETNGINGAYTPSQIFTNAAAGDFTLVTGSPAINAGTTQASFTNDYDNYTRPIGGTWDMGAYEYGAQPPPSSANRLKRRSGLSRSIMIP